MGAKTNARLQAARAKLRQALAAQFQPKTRYRQGVVDFVEYGPDGNLKKATMTVDGVGGRPATPVYKSDIPASSDSPAAPPPPAATLPTPTGLALVSTWRTAELAAI